MERSFKRNETFRPASTSLDHALEVACSPLDRPTRFDRSTRQSVKRVERSNGLDTVPYKNIQYNLSIAVTVGTAQYDRYGQVAAMESFMTCH